jgi:hypothetical protein
MSQDIDYTQALADIKQGFQNVIVRVQVSGNNVTLVQGTEMYKFPISPPVTSTNILK